jgi:SAM-dependent methyltransferase
MDHETDFLSGLIELQHGEKVVDKLKNISKKVSWAKGWPDNNRAFWNAEAYMWKWKIDKEKRELIANELKKVCSKSNLDLGAGAYSYIPSTCFDFSDKALHLNDNCSKRIVGDLEQKLPFGDEEFDSVTAIFVLNYVNSLANLLKEITRVLKENGTFVAVFGAKGINEWQAAKEKNNFNYNKWKHKFSSLGFKFKSFEKKGLWFFICNKKICSINKDYKI